MQAEIRNYRAISRARVSANPVALVAGQNAQGKSSVLEAVAAALAQEPVPFLEPSGSGGYRRALKKEAARALVNDGAKSGSAVIRGDGGESKVNWPGLSRADNDGAGPRASVYAAGLLDIPALPDAARRAALWSLLRPDVGWAQVEAAAPMAADDSAAPVREAFEASGWDAAEKEARELASRARGRWESRTGERFGSAKAPAWRPAGYPVELDGLDEDHLAGCVSSAQAAVESAEARARAAGDALTEAAQGREALDRAQNRHAGLQQQLREARQTLEVAQTHAAKVGEPSESARETYNARVAERERLEKRLEDLYYYTDWDALHSEARSAPDLFDRLQKAAAVAGSGPEPRVDAHCPACSEPLSIHPPESAAVGPRVELGRRKHSSDVAELDAALDRAHDAAERLADLFERKTALGAAVEEAEEAEGDARKAMGVTPATAREAQQRLGSAEAEVERLEDAVDGAEAEIRAVWEQYGPALRADGEAIGAESEDAEGELGYAREALEAAQSRHGLFVDAREAAALAGEVAGLVRLADALASDGVRLAAIQGATQAWLETVNTMAADVGWGPVTVDDDLGFGLAGRPWHLLSESDRFRLRVLVRLAAAVQDGSDAVVIDGADVLDRDGRNALFGLLTEFRGLLVYVGMTANAPEAVPDLARAAIGSTYWLEGGEVRPVTAEAASA